MPYLLGHLCFTHTSGSLTAVRTLEIPQILVLLMQLIMMLPAS